ncbi:SCO4848 family membrane protein [Stackebrandtia albiflava]|uniref:SCO4848 family membrane protein n=1 Tax=Stackebrandtia albiflava TaxID=406432 RepID=UPI0011BDD71B|nr:hypothetical protein [Stackebrandtia albiflava]
MKLSKPAALFLAGLAVFMVFEWTMLAFNLAEGHPTAFYVVHGVLIGGNIVLAVVVAAIVWRAWAAERRRR